MSDQALRELEVICLDAHLIDVDLSIWDQAIRFVVIACDLPSRAGWMPVYCVEFQTVYRLDFQFNHHERGFEPQRFKGVGPHIQWRIHQLVWEESSKGFILQLAGSQEFPTVVIECGAVDVRVIDDALLNKHFPGWRAPGGPFLRSGVEEWLTRQSK